MTDRPRALRTPSGRVFATIHQADELTVSTQGGAAVQTRLHGLLLRTTPRAGDLPLFVRNDELLFAGVLQAGQSTGLGWSPAAGPHMRVAPPRDPRVRFVQRPDREVACADLTLVPGYGEHESGDHGLRARPSIAVAASPGGPAAVELRLAKDVLIAQLDRNGPQAKIAWSIEEGALADATVIGWVDARLVTDFRGGKGGSGMSGMSGMGMGMEGTSHWSGCRTDHPLLVDAGRGPEEVGTILAGTRITRGPRRGALVAVDIVGPALRHNPAPFQLRAGVRFLLAPADATECGG